MTIRVYEFVFVVIMIFIYYGVRTVVDEVSRRFLA